MVENRRLDAFSLAALMMSAHYGLGFILGTAEKSLTLGMASSLYAVCLGLGTIAILGLAKFYWTKVEPMWTLLGSYYGTGSKILVGLMSWVSLIGIAAAQLISGAFILKIFGAPVLASMVVLALCFTIISLLPVEKASWLFRVVLLLNFLALLYGLLALHGLPVYGYAPLEFIRSLKLVNPPNLVGISLCTILWVLIGMKYQQFIVQARDLRSLYQGCILAAILLLLLAFLPSSIVLAAETAGILPDGIDGKETLPFILSWIGGGTDKPLGILLLMSLLIPAFGVGSSILRVQSKTIFDFNILPVSKFYQLLVPVVNALLSLVVALKGGEIVNRMVSFYAAYIATVLVPFVIYLLAEYNCYKLAKISGNLSLTLGSISASFVLVLTLIEPRFAVLGSVELTIMVIGVVFGVLGLLVGEVIEKYFTGDRVEEV